MYLTKKHKMYYRDPKSGTARRLDKTSRKLYLYIINIFIKGNAEKRYQEVNKTVTHWRGYKAIDLLDLPVELQAEVEKLTKQKSIEIYYGGTWKPLVRLHKFKNK